MALMPEDTSLFCLRNGECISAITRALRSSLLKQRIETENELGLRGGRTETHNFPSIAWA